MQTRELNRATMEVANTMNISGTANADEFNRAFPTGKERSLVRIGGLTGVGSLMAACLFIAMAPIPAWAAAGEVPAEIAALQAQVAALQSQVNTLQTQLATVQSNNALQLGPFVSVNPNGTGPDKGVKGPNIYFTGANIHIVSGSGSTSDGTSRLGLGNLIIGYDETTNVLNTGDRGGSHNLVIGPFHKFTSNAFGGLVAGEENTIEGAEASILGGVFNVASGSASTICGGLSNVASGSASTVCGGQSNVTSGTASTICGGQSNLATIESAEASILGGSFNVVSGDGTICGGAGNQATNTDTTVVAGTNNTASGIGSVVLGGDENTAGGVNDVVLGGQHVSSAGGQTILPQPPFP